MRNLGPFPSLSYLLGTFVCLAPLPLHHDQGEIACSRASGFFVEDLSCTAVPGTTSLPPPTKKSPEHPVGDTTRFELRQMAVFTLPDGFAITGITLGSADRLLIWSVHPPCVFQLSAEEWQILGRGLLRHPISAAYGNDMGSIEIIDAALLQIIHFSADGHLAEQVGIYGLPDLSAATRSTDGWYVLPGPRSDPYVYRVDPDGRAHRVAAVPVSDAWQADSTRAVLILSPDTDGVLLSSRFPPFSSVRVAHSGQVYPFPLPALASKLKDETDPAVGRGIWVALPMLEGPAGYIQTYADLTSDRRVIAVFSTGGSLLREVTLEMPVGFQASLPRQSLLVGVTRLNAVEIRLYRWRWDEPEGESGEKG
jgi:hypothetical protein